VPDHREMQNRSDRFPPGASRLNSVLVVGNYYNAKEAGVSNGNPCCVSDFAPRCAIAQKLKSVHIMSFEEFRRTPKIAVTPRWILLPSQEAAKRHLTVAVQDDRIS
jgi:hypothetical protein